MASREDYIIEFASAVAPGYPELLLSSSTEQSILEEATKLINYQRTALTAAEEERDRLLSERQELINAIEDMLDRQLRCRLSKCLTD